ncbi:class I SAM-dependent methyltransferase [Staphylococcus agnetis]|uniref:class I SAM-dependent methyltransferase n=1 Tax=Staphylococcus agnetis TaxID=985762 RepID=UPI00208ED842|nr:class I SAM-dependent methyltransferase [Staphylococcus agnetis]MCO4365753.1 class I SAM-dependent methyltransferase [Staphylococcus agnetis]
MQQILNHLKSYEAFEAGADNIWTSKKFEEFVLKSYVDPSIPGGGQTLEDTSDLFNTLDNLKFVNRVNLLDIGCGVGTHCEEFNSRGFNVTGIDISKKAIDYAKEQNYNLNADIKYICGDIFKTRFKNKFEIVTILYKTLATFSEVDRKVLMNKIKSILSSEGLLIFDVPSIEEFKSYNEINLWTTLPKNNIILKEELINLISVKKYPKNILLNQNIYMTEKNEIFAFNDWLQFFALEGIKKECEDNGFEVFSVINNNEQGITLAVKVRSSKNNETFSQYIFYRLTK